MVKRDISTMNFSLCDLALNFNVLILNIAQKMCQLEETCNVQNA